MAARAVGIRFWRINSFAKILDDSSRAADFVGPKTRNRSAPKTSTIPAASGSSGPTTVRSMRFSFAKRARPGKSLALRATFSPISSVPALPGAQKMRSTAHDCFNFQASACSRPPLPTMRSFTTTTLADVARRVSSRGYSLLASGTFSPTDAE
jgi:hypothetical protein